MLSDDSNCARTRTQSALFPFDHALCPDCTTFLLGLRPLVCSKLRSKLFLRTFLSSGAPLCAFWPARRADFLPIVAPGQPYFAGKPPFARLRPTWVVVCLISWILAHFW